MAILRFAYRDDWQAVTYGGGFSLVAAGNGIGEATPDARAWQKANLWAASTTFGGDPAGLSPPVAPDSGYATWADDHGGVGPPEADFDTDGATNLEEYAVGSNPRQPFDTPTLRILTGPDGGLSLSSPILERPDLQVIIETSPDLRQWQAFAVWELPSSTHTVARMAQTQFLRVRLTLIP